MSRRRRLLFLHDRHLYPQPPSSSHLCARTHTTLPLVVFLASHFFNLPSRSLLAPLPISPTPLFPCSLLCGPLLPPRTPQPCALATRPAARMRHPFPPSFCLTTPQRPWSHPPSGPTRPWRWSPHPPLLPPPRRGSTPSSSTARPSRRTGLSRRRRRRRTLPRECRPLRPPTRAPHPCRQALAAVAEAAGMTAGVGVGGSSPAIQRWRSS